MVRKKVLLIYPTIHPEGVKLLQSQVDIIMAPDGKENTIVEYVKDKTIEALIARVEVISKKIIDNAVGLRVIGQNGAGLDNIDVKAATDRGIKVVNAPGENAISVAEHAIMLMLGISRRIIEADAAVRCGDWQFRNRKIPTEINGKTLLLFGFGAIGKNVAQKARAAFCMKLYAYDPLVTDVEMRRFGVEKVNSIRSALSLADYISVHVPLTDATRGMLGEKEFNEMKKTAYVINTSRGAILNEEALIQSLSKGEIAGAALDVFETEPPLADNKLLGFSNVIITPHFGGDTNESKQRTSLAVAKAVLNALE